MNRKLVEQSVEKLGDNIDNFSNILNMLRGFSGLVKEEYRNLYESTLNMFDSYIEKHDNLWSDLWVICGSKTVKYTDAELDAMCLKQEKEQIYKNYRAAIDEYNKLQEEYKSLKKDHEQLQDLFVAVDFELDELKCIRDNMKTEHEEKYSSLQKNYRTVVRELNKCINQNLELARELDER